MQLPRALPYHGAEPGQLVDCCQHIGVVLHEQRQNVASLLEYLDEVSLLVLA